MSALLLLKARGHSDVKHVAQGLFGWWAAGLEVDASAGAEFAVGANGPEEEAVLARLQEEGVGGPALALALARSSER